MIHLDLFSGIGGFAYAVDQVWYNAEHIFCDNDKFCQQVLRKHWPNSKIYEDIRTITDTKSFRNGRSTSQKRSANKRKLESSQSQRGTIRGKGEGCVGLLTGGFPCQPFSQAGRRKGTADDRYLWPEMFRVIRLTKPRWVIAENVAGLITWNNGLVLEQVCSDLEAEGYEVQPFVIPAVAVNAPHRRDRVWIIANYQRNVRSGIRRRNIQGIGGKRQSFEGWADSWLEVATELCRVDDGLSAGLDFAGWTKAQHRVQRLKALGNAIVPEVAIRIMEAIKTASEDKII